MLTTCFLIHIRKAISQALQAQEVADTSGHTGAKRPRSREVVLSPPTRLEWPGLRWWHAGCALVGVVFSAAAPVLMADGWTVTASVQPRFDPVAGTVSALAARGAADR
jgi:hypothetical protein